MAKITIMSLADWAKADVDEIRERWVKRRIEIEEIEKKKTEKEKRIEEARKRKEEKRRKAIRERRCFVCNIFGHMARYCRNRGEKEGPAQVPLNRFEVLKDRVMQKGEGSGREIGKNWREILREERKKKNVQAQMPGKDKKEKRKGVEEKKDDKIEEEREVEMRDFSRGEILKGRYPLVWWKVQCYECGGLGHRKRDHGEMKRNRIEKDKKKNIGKEKINEIEKKKEDKKMEKKIEKEETKKKERVQAQTPGKDKKKKIKRRDIGVETEREIVEKRDMEIAIEEEIVDKIDEKREIGLREREKKVEKREKEI